MNNKQKIIVIIALLFFFLLGFMYGLKEACSKEIADWDGVVIHHTASPSWTTVEDIDEWHRQRGWDGIGYHFVIYVDGSIHQGRPINKQGAHAKSGRSNSRNGTHIGIALVGEDEYTEAQMQALTILIFDLDEKYGIRFVENHHEECPGKGLPDEFYTSTGIPRSYGYK